MPTVTLNDLTSPVQQDTLIARLRLATVIVITCFLVLLGRLAYLQVVQKEYYRERAESNRILSVPDPPTRGIIFDRSGQILARNYSAYTLEIAPSIIDEEATDLPPGGRVDGIINRVNELISVHSKDRNRLKRLREERRDFQYFPIRTHLTDEEVAKIIANRYRLPGVEVRARLFRQYPENTIASHAIGYIGRITDRDNELIDKNGETDNYRGTDYIGKNGLEYYYEFALHGKSGSQDVEVSATRRVVRSLRQEPSSPGKNLVLTLDIGLQKIVEQAFGNRKGALVAIDPNTGGILAFVSMPGYDPNLFVDGIASDEWRLLNESPDKPMVNRVINGIYPPGSTFKPFMALAALENGKRTPSQAINDPGYFSFGNHVFRDDKKGGHGVVDMYRSIVMSCDTYYYQLANDMGIEMIAEFMGKIGFGQSTGIDLPNESTGVLPSQAWKQRRFKQPALQKWIPGETISIGIGQGYNAYTPLQLALATATIAGDGVKFQPHLVRDIVDPISGQKQAVAPSPLTRLALAPAHLEVIKHAMEGVIKEGTAARPFAGTTYRVAGKTGTAQVFSLKGEKYELGRVREHLRDHALFIAFAPVEAPKIALAIVVENGGFGAEAAAPIARLALDYYLSGKSPVNKTTSAKANQ